MQQLLMFVTETGFKVRTLEDTSAMGERMAIEECRNQGWSLVLSEYIPLSKTRISVLAKAQEVRG